MPRVELASSALHDLQRLRELFRPKNPAAARRAGAAIIKVIQLLATHPKIGRPVEEMEIEYRELVIDFGDSGYIALYRYVGDVVTVLSFRHQKEAGYLSD
jgi:plasmid stabilization system protein ParE